MKNKIENLIDNLKPIHKWGAGLLLALTLSVFVDGPSKAATESSTAIDTFIPSGHVLVPIEVANYQSLDSVLGPYGVVDLYSINAQGEPLPRPVAMSIKILRSPEKPDHFGVLASEQNVQKILQQGSIFFVVVKNPDRAGTELVNDQPATGIRIIVEDRK